MGEERGVILAKRKGHALGRTCRRFLAERKGEGDQQRGAL